ncbi:hypothetical protein [Propioniferax innocua]|uniref:Uncharacterized protein n=1 Tax=Propioniferax innocua TaxID=1753 RepID=A0A542ZBU0_9ACTN|nr:hypothetical protein [Propioniferax innocua]TQL57812.1 hypothetical protein FB460_1654 [Propioniferax innocua]
MQTIDFVVLENHRLSILEVVPHVDGSSLIELVAAFESSQGFTPSGAYGGLIPDFINCGDLNAYYLGRSKIQWPEPGRRAWLLGCDCGEVGCWPFEAEITETDGTVVWTGFRQPCQPGWNYSSFGPFVFDAAEYREAVAQAASRVPQT